MAPVFAGDVVVGFGEDEITIRLQQRLPAGSSDEEDAGPRERTFNDAFGLYIWPSASTLSHLVWERRHQLKGKRILELGAGTALPSLVAATLGASVIITDRKDYRDVLENIRDNCKLNGLEQSCVVKGLSWGLFCPCMFSLPLIDIILGADCFYESQDFDRLLGTVAFLLERNPGAVMWTAYQQRSSSRSVAHLMSAYGLTGQLLPPCDLSIDTNTGSSVQLWQITRCGS